ncbi:MAG: hypothetical protein HY298_16425 [Verrucomicrobia bacterium]|nr:hypothetical protein [Verrucomicrobiota bacterium]
MKIIDPRNKQPEQAGSKANFPNRSSVTKKPSNKKSMILIPNHQVLARLRHGLIGALFATLLISGSLVHGATYFSENFDATNTDGYISFGWDFGKNGSAAEVGTDFWVAQYPYADADYQPLEPAPRQPDSSFFWDSYVTNLDKIVTPPTVDGTGSSRTNGGYLISDSDAAGGSDNIGSLSEFWAITPSFSTVGATDVWWHADVDIDNNNNGECIVDLGFSVDGGTTWTQVWATAEPQRPIKSFGFNQNVDNTFEGGTPIDGYPVLGSYSQTKTWSGIHGRWHVHLPAQANNQASVKMRIRYVEPADAWWIALDNILVDNNPPPKGSQVVLFEQFESGIPGTWANTGVTRTNGLPMKWATEPLRETDGTLSKKLSATDTNEVNVDLVRYLQFLRDRGTNIAPTAVLNWSVTNFIDYPDLQTYHPNNPTDGRLMMMLAGGNYAMWQPDTSNYTNDLDTPSLNLTGKSEVFLDFDSEWLHGVYNSLDPTLSQIFLVEVSLDGGATFNTIFDYQKGLSNIGEASYFMHHYIPVPQAAGKSSVIFRFHAQGLDTGNAGTRHQGFWVIDNVRVTANVLAITSISTSGGNVTVNWPGGPGIRLQKSTNLTNPLSWADIGTTLGNSTHSEALTSTPTFFRLSKP